MKKRLAIIIFVFSLTSAAQSQSHSEIIWRQFNNLREEFAVQFPTDNFKHVGRESVQKHRGNYQAYGNKTYFFIHSTYDIKKSSFARLLQTLVTPGALEKEVTIDGNKGRRYSFKTNDGFYHIFIAIPTKKRFYIFHTVSEFQESSDSDLFFESIKLHRKVVQKKTN